jgi:hypothetical protein
LPTAASPWRLRSGPWVSPPREADG